MSIDLADAPPAPAGGASPTPAGRSRAASAGRGVRVKQPFGRISGPTLGVLVIWLSLIVLLPLTAVVGKAFGSGGSAFWSAISNREVRDALYLTVGLAVGVAVVNAVMGLLIADQKSPAPEPNALPTTAVSGSRTIRLNQMTSTPSVGPEMRPNGCLTRTPRPADALPGGVGGAPPAGADGASATSIVIGQALRFVLIPLSPKNSSLTLSQPPR
ncbi:MAG TPA: hypothetical protein VGF84_04750, partial [Micromonosporaceae bacterium]